MQDLNDDLEIPAFLRRDKNEAPRSITERKPQIRKLSAKAEREREINRIADRRWRQWRPTEDDIRSAIIAGHGEPRRPRRSTFRKLVRKELAAIDDRIAKREGK